MTASTSSARPGSVGSQAGATAVTEKRVSFQPHRGYKASPGRGSSAGRAIVSSRWKGEIESPGGLLVPSPHRRTRTVAQDGALQRDTSFRVYSVIDCHGYAWSYISLPLFIEDGAGNAVTLSAGSCRGKGGLTAGASRRLRPAHNCPRSCHFFSGLNHLLDRLMAEEVEYRPRDDYGPSALALLRDD